MKWALGPLIITITFPVGAADNAEDEGWSTSAVVIDRIADGAEDAAFRFYQNFFRESDYEFMPGARIAARRARAIANIVKNPLWRTLTLGNRLQYLKTSLRHGPLTPVLERELLFHVYKLGTLEAIAYLLEYGAEGSRGAYLEKEIALPSLIPGWRQWWHALTGQIVFLKSEGFVSSGEIHELVRRWAGQFETPNDLMDQVDGSTSAAELRAIYKIMAMMPGWQARLHGVGGNKYRFFVEGQACQDALTRPRSEHP